MSRVTLAVRLKPEANKSGENVVRVRITKDRTISYWALNLTIPEKHFNPNGTKLSRNWVRKSFYDAGSYNERILFAYRQAEKAIEFFERNGKEYTVVDIKTYLENGGYPDRLLPFFKAHIQTRRAEAGDDLGKIRTADGYESTIKVLRNYLRETHSLPDQITDDEIDTKYWLLSQFTKAEVLTLKAWLDKNYAHNSVTSYLSNLRFVLYLAADKGLISLERFPMRGITIGVKRKKVDRFQDEEIDFLAEAEDNKKHRGKKSFVTSSVHAKPLALIIYYTHGARIQDVLLWRIENYVIEGDKHRLRYTTGKNKKEMSVLLDEEAITIFKPYRFTEDGQPRKPTEFILPYVPSNYDTLSVNDKYLVLRRAKIRARQQLIRFGQRAGVAKHLTPHILRHSFADMMRRAGIPLETRQMSLGHSDIRTTRDYEEQFDQEAVDEVSLLYQNRRKKKEDNSSKTIVQDGADGSNDTDIN